MKTCYSVILVLILCIYSPAFIKVHAQVIRSSRIESSVSELGHGRWKISLSPKDRWFNTNISVVRGATINIFATGFVTWAPPGGRDMSPTVGPIGTRPPFAEDRNRFPMPYAGCGSLIMRIGNSMYSVGEGGSVEVNESGTIQLMVNDDVLSDNSGGFSVDMEIPQSRNQNKSNYLVFSSQRDGNQEVYLLDLTTERATNLSQSSDEDGYPRCSTDGRRIAFATNRDGYWEIYLMNRDGSGQRNLTNNRGGNGYMDWSPDGRSLVFASTRNGEKKNELYTIRADGTGLRRLTNHPAEDVHPAWSPDGRKIAFASERDGNRQIYVMNADGTNLTRLMSNRWYDDYPAWSPDSSQITFASDRDSRSSERLDIYVANAAGSDVTRITSHPADDRHPSWSLDGSLLAFASDRNGDRDIFIVRIDGTGLKKVFSSDGNDEHPHWCRNTAPSLSTSSSKPTIVLPSPRTFSVVVSANAAWIDTGIKVEVGQHLTITASGVVNTERGYPVSNSDANGQPIICNVSNCILQGAGFGTLVGRIGSGEPFRVGSYLETTATSNGKLYLVVNDSDFSDNSGSFSIRVNTVIEE